MPARRPFDPWTYTLDAATPDHPVLEVRVSFAEHLRSLLSQREMSLADFSHAVGFTAGYARVFLQVPQEQYTPAVLQAVARALGLPYEDVAKLAGYLPADESEKCRISGWTQSTIRMYVAPENRNSDHMRRLLRILARLRTLPDLAPVEAMLDSMAPEEPTTA